METLWLTIRQFEFLEEDAIWYAVLVIVAGILAMLWTRGNRNLPPGPIGLPLVGYLPFLRRDAFVQLAEIGQKYGPIFSFYLGRNLVVVLNSFDVVKEALMDSNIMDRPPHPPNHLLPDSKSLSTANGHVWKEQRTFSVQLLRQLGMGKDKMEEMIKEEFNYFFTEIASHKGKPMNLSELILPSVSNNMVAMIIGQRLDYEHPDRKFLNDMLKVMTLYFRPTRVHAYFPYLRKWMSRFHIWGYDRVERIMDQFANYIEDQIDAHIKTLENTNVRDYIDGYLISMMNDAKSENTSSSLTSSFSRKMLKGNIQSLLGAGSTPARATIEWAIVSLVNFPEIQKRVHEELDSVVGRDRLPSWTDRNQLPYTSAVIMEVLRNNTIIPISMLRKSSSTVRIGGYQIPKDTMIMTNIWGVHHDPKYWDDPYSFRPERFLKESRIYKPPYYIPFSYGKRNCPGEDMAQMEVFLYITCLVHTFDIKSPPGKEHIFKEELGIARLVFPDNICLISRA